MDSPRRPRASFSKGNVLARGPGTLSHPAVRVFCKGWEKEYLGAGMGFLIHNILWPRGQRNVKNPMASLAFQGRLKAS